MSNGNIKGNVPNFEGGEYRLEKLSIFCCILHKINTWISLRNFPESTKIVNSNITLQNHRDTTNVYSNSIGFSRVKFEKKDRGLGLRNPQKNNFGTIHQSAASIQLRSQSKQLKAGQVFGGQLFLFNFACIKLANTLTDKSF